MLPIRRPAPDRRRPTPLDRGRGEILIILHQEHSTPGRVGRLLVERGYGLDIRRPRFGDPLPATMADHAGAVVFGGPMSANDGDAWLKAEIDWLGVPLAEEKPYLGLCLGAQMLVKYLGGTVATHGDGRAEIGYYPISPTPLGLGVVPASHWPAHVYQWHREGFDCPHGAHLVATGPGDFPVQAILAGTTCYGLQFHPEVTHAMMCRWTTRAHERMAMPGAQPRHAHIDGWYTHDAAVRTWLDAFLDVWLAGPVPAAQRENVTGAPERDSAPDAARPPSGLSLATTAPAE